MTRAYGPTINQLQLPRWPLDVDYAQRIAAGTIWVLDENDRPVAILDLHDHGDGLLVESLAVVPACRRRGFGRALVDFAENEARRRHCGCLWL